MQTITAMLPEKELDDRGRRIAHRLLSERDVPDSARDYFMFISRIKKNEFGEEWVAVSDIVLELLKTAKEHAEIKRLCRAFGRGGYTEDRWKALDDRVRSRDWNRAHTTLRQLPSAITEHQFVFIHLERCLRLLCENRHQLFK